MDFRVRDTNALIVTPINLDIDEVRSRTGEDLLYENNLKLDQYFM